jgi:methylmalonyl-CoA mutase N-terminal domain/subunit
MQQQIAESAYAYQQAIESNEKVIVGVNSFVTNNEKEPSSIQIDESIRVIQTKKLTGLKNTRDQHEAARCLRQLKDAASGEANLMPFIIEAVECHCTLGEISDTLRSVFGEHQQ